MSLGELLTNLLSTDNDARKAAEAQWDQAKKSDPNETIKSLIQAITSAPAEQQRQQAGVLCRQCIQGIGKEEPLWLELSAETTTALKAALLASVEHDTCWTVKRSAATCVVAIGEVIADDLPELTKEWAELLPTLSRWAAAGSPTECRVSSLQILKDLVPTVGEGLTDPPYRDSVSGLVMTCLEDTVPQIRAKAAQLVLQFIEDLPTEKAAPLAGMLPKVLKVMQSLEKEDELLKETLESMVSAAEQDEDIRTFTPQLENVWQAMLIICQAKGHISDECRRTAMEVNITFIEEGHATLERQDESALEKMIEQILQVSFEWMLEVDDELEEWTKQIDDDDDDDEETCQICGETTYDRVADACEEEVVQRIIFKIISSALAQGHWKHMRAALMAINQTVEYIEEESRVDQCVDFVKSQMKHAHARVRYTAFQAMGQIAMDHEPYAQETHHETVLPLIVQGVDDENPRVAAQAIDAFVKFGEELAQEDLEPFLEALMTKLFQRLQSGQSRTMSENCLQGIAVIGEVAEELFEPYYPTVMPILKEIVMRAKGEKERSIRGKAFECISLLGAAVGKERFLNDANETMTEMINTLKAGLAEDDVQKKYINDASERICTTLEKHFKPYLAELLPRTFEALNVKPKEISAADDLQDDDDEDDMTLMLVGEKICSLKTAVIEEMDDAVSLIETFISSLEEEFMEFIPATYKHMLLLLQYPATGLQESVFKTWRSLTVVARKCVEAGKMQTSDLKQFVTGFLEAVVTAMPGKPVDPEIDADLEFSKDELTTIQAQAEGISNVIRNAGIKVLDNDAVRNISNVVVKMLQCVENDRKKKDEVDDGKKKKSKDDDSDSDDSEEDATSATVRLALADIVGGLLKSNREEFVQAGLPVFMTMVQSLITPNNSEDDRGLALYVADDIVDCLGEQSLPYWNVIMEPAAKYITESKSFVVKEYSCSILGHGAKLPQFAPIANFAGNQLGQFLEKHLERYRRRRAVNKDAKQVASAVDAAILALGYLCDHHEQNIQDPQKFWDFWLKALPLKYDQDRAWKAHAQLLELFIKERPLLVGQGGMNVPKILGVFADVYDTKNSNNVLDSELAQAVSALGEEKIKMICAAGVTDKQKKKVEQMIKHHTQNKARLVPNATAGGYPSSE